MLDDWGRPFCSDEHREEFVEFGPVRGARRPVVLLSQSPEPPPPKRLPVPRPSPVALPKPSRKRPVIVLDSSSGESGTTNESSSGNESSEDDSRPSKRQKGQSGAAVAKKRRYTGSGNYTKAQLRDRVDQLEAYIKQEGLKLPAWPKPPAKIVPRPAAPAGQASTPKGSRAVYRGAEWEPERQRIWRGTFRRLFQNKTFLAHNPDIDPEMAAAVVAFTSKPSVPIPQPVLARLRRVPWLVVERVAGPGPGAAPGGADFASISMQMRSSKGSTNWVPLLPAPTQTGTSFIHASRAACAVFRPELAEAINSAVDKGAMTCSHLAGDMPNQAIARCNVNPWQVTYETGALNVSRDACVTAVWANALKPGANFETVAQAARGTCSRVHPAHDCLFIDWRLAQYQPAIAAYKAMGAAELARKASGVHGSARHMEAEQDADGLFTRVCPRCHRSSGPRESARACSGWFSQHKCNPAPTQH